LDGDAFLINRNAAPLGSSPSSHPASSSSSSTKQLGAQQMRGLSTPFFLRYKQYAFLPNQVRFPLSCEESPHKRAAVRQPRIEAPPQPPAVVSVPVFAGSTEIMPESTAT
jgi:hypothetical protein